jgi:formylglycine-generating enzyme required for sulfatase activity
LSPIQLRRAGTTTDYCFGNNQLLLGQYAWFNGNASMTSHAVGQKIPNAWGLYDMHGNVREWCSDFWSWRYSTGLQIDPQGSMNGTERLRRGGAWSYYPEACKCGARDSCSPDISYYDVGLRVVLEGKDGT